MFLLDQSKLRADHRKSESSSQIPIATVTMVRELNLQVCYKIKLYQLKSKGDRINYFKKLFNYSIINWLIIPLKK